MKSFSRNQKLFIALVAALAAAAGVLFPEIAPQVADASAWLTAQIGGAQ